MLTGRFSATEMSRGNVTHAFPAWQIAELLRVYAKTGEDGGENLSLVILCELLRKNSEL